jgi:hypothetical protein
MEEKAQLKDLVRHGRIYWILKNMTGIYGLDSSGPELALVGQVMALQAL